MIKKLIKDYKMIFIAIMAYIIAAFYNPSILSKAFSNTWIYLKEMIEILPAVFVLSSLVNTWVPREVILNNFGKDSGIRGKLISVFIGSVSAGPIYAAFPITQSLMKKGASIANTVIIISSWAVVKVPMLIVESKFLGIKFALIRYCLTIPAIILIGIISEKILNRKEDIKISSLSKNSTTKTQKIVEELPGYNCGACGYNSCHEYAKAIVKEGENINRCKVGESDIKNKINEII